MQAEVAALLGPDGAIPGALRILTRCGDSQVLIVHGAERHVDAAAGERLAWIDWYESDDAARRISNRCSTYLAEAGLPPDTKGWHPYSVAHLKTLVCAAQNLLNIKPIPPPERSPAERRSWTAHRIAWFGYLVGRGATAKAIADDPQIATTENNVYRQAHRFGLALSAKAFGQLVLRRLPSAALAHLDADARHAGLTREAYASRVLIEALERSARSSHPAALQNAAL